MALWADIGSEDFWRELRHKREYVPFEERWPQPGFVGTNYFGSSPRVVVMGQNPRASDTRRASKADQEMSRLIRRHSRERTPDSLEALLDMMGRFMRGVDYKPAWRPLTMARRQFGLELDDIAYLNLIPLATVNDKIMAFQEPFERATKRQLELLQPSKVVVPREGGISRVPRS